jgi:hypothetical protein
MGGDSDSAELEELQVLPVRFAVGGEEVQVFPVTFKVGGEVQALVVAVAAGDDVANLEFLGEITLRSSNEGNMRAVLSTTGSLDESFSDGCRRRRRRCRWRPRWLGKRSVATRTGAHVDEISAK